MAWIKRHWPLAWLLGLLAAQLLVVLAGAILPWGLKEVFGDAQAFDPWSAWLWLWWIVSFFLVVAGWLLLVFLDRLGKEEVKDGSVV